MMMRKNDGRPGSKFTIMAGIVAAVVIIAGVIISSALTNSPFDFRPAANTTQNFGEIPQVIMLYDGKEYRGMMWSRDWNGQETSSIASIPEESVNVNKGSTVQFITKASSQPDTFTIEVLDVTNRNQIEELQKLGNGSANTYVINIDKGESILKATAEWSNSSNDPTEPTGFVTYVFKVNVTS